jgi:hypothetical protein
MVPPVFPDGLKLEMAVFLVAIRRLELGYEILTGILSLTVIATGIVTAPVALLAVTATVVVLKSALRLDVLKAPVDVLKLIPTADRAELAALVMLYAVTVPPEPLVGLAETVPPLVYVKTLLLG